MKFLAQYVRVFLVYASRRSLLGSLFSCLQKVWDWKLWRLKYAAQAKRSWTPSILPQQCLSDQISDGRGEVSQFHWRISSVGLLVLACFGVSEVRAPTWSEIEEGPQNLSGSHEKEISFSRDWSKQKLPFFPHWSKQESSQSSRNETPHFSFQISPSQLPTVALLQETEKLSCSMPAFPGKHILL